LSLLSFKILRIKKIIYTHIPGFSAILQMQTKMGNLILPESFTIMKSMFFPNEFGNKFMFYAEL
jgi:hypothetical protein